MTSARPEGICVGPVSDSNLNHIESINESIKNSPNTMDDSEVNIQKENVIDECEVMLQQLEELWEYLHAPNSHRSKYRNIAAKRKVASVQELSHELQECKRLKQENVEHFIKRLRIQLVEQWDKTYRSQKYRKNLEFLHSDPYTEDLLKALEMKLEKNTRFYDKNKTIFDLFNSRNKLWEKKKALETIQNGQPNWHHIIDKQLLKDQIDLDILKIEDRIIELVEVFQHQNNFKFTINRKCIIELMHRDWDAYPNSATLDNIQARVAQLTNIRPLFDEQEQSTT